LKILLVRLREIGDVVFTTPSIRALRQHFPDAHLSYIVEPVAAPIVAHNPHLNAVIVAPRRGLVADLALGRRLRREKYDVAIDFHGGPRASLLAWLSGARERIGYDVPGRAWMYTRRVRRPRELRPRHSVENQWDLLAALGIAPPDRSRSAVEMAVDGDAAFAVARRLAEAGVERSHDIVVVHVSAGNPFRRWPLEHFATLAVALAAGGSARRIVLTSGPSDRDAAAAVVADARQRLKPDERGRIVACGDFTLAELRALMDGAALFIGGDSGPLHVASTSRAPILGLYGPTLPARSAPWRDPSIRAEAVEVLGLPCRPCDQRVCAPGDFRCLTTIAPEQVAAAAEGLLKRA
jgi:predicted lipopolysaccharide heptosyltransferase III